jgi:hypothetical protein
VHLTVNAELITTTADHPFYVKDIGFVNAEELQIGDRLLDSSGNVLTVENTAQETTETPTKVYNFQVEDFHTYHVGAMGVLVHNANYPKNPDDLLQQGYKETTPEGMKNNTSSREFFNPETGDTVRFDQGKQGATGFESVDHYHQQNPAATGKGDFYLDSNGNPVPKGSRKSHILPIGEE